MATVHEHGSAGAVVVVAADLSAAGAAVVAAGAAVPAREAPAAISAGNC